ncbi:hypothetical protein ACRALDRAFT_1071574 [Sodiomyces alcalophilus JCM 7366]|uniref:uncharacterized protein n=1 Tax=Sodiomyces alcalophilus JCM 7366 TaxID=591952 RepID=UPI0039B577F0
MPPAPSQKGTSKKGGAGGIRQRSRNTTPSSAPVSVPPPATASLPPIEAIDAEYLSLRVEQFDNIGYDDIVDQINANVLVPESKHMDAMITRLTRLQEVIDRRTNFCDKAMRDLALQRKTYVGNVPERDDLRDNEGQKRANKKKRKAADTLAPGDAVHKERTSPLRDPSKTRKLSRDESAASPSPAGPGSPSAAKSEGKKKKAKEEEKVEQKREDDEEDEEESSSEDEGAPPRPALPAANTFGDDPSTFPDPTLYEILPTHPGMTPEEIRETYSVAVYPKNDLSDIIPGDPPDKDFSNTKPTNQISFSTFSTYIEPYFKPFTEEDLGFLRERGDRVVPFTIPNRGKKHYTEVWAEEDGAMQIDSPLPTREKQLPANQARGSIEHMDDEVGETDKLAVGPLLSRLLAATRGESRPQSEEEKQGATNGATNGGGGDTHMTNGEAGDQGPNGAAADDGKPQAIPPAAFMPESNSETWKKATHPKLDYAQVDERIKQELRHMGFLPKEGANLGAEFDGAFDDEVAARLRLLQDRLRQQVLVNGARKARLTDLVRERMAYQEYQTILEDLDSQVQAAYTKRTRTMGKSKKTKRPGAGAAVAAAQGAAGMARPGIGDVTRTLMERRKRWINTIGSVFDDENVGKVPRASNPDSSIFKPAELAALIKKEKEQWDDEVEEAE